MTELDKNKKTVEAYDKNPQFYADKFDSYGIRIEDIDRALKLNESRSNKVLELGSGSGRDAEYIISKVGKDNYVGIDASAGLVDIARKKNPEATFHVKDMRLFDDVTPETLGIVFSFASVLHVNREELAELIEKCHKWLKIGGILFISTKYGEYRELEIENLGDKKYYYSYKPEDVLEMADNRFKVLFNVIGDSDYGPIFSLVLRKTHG